MNRVLVLGNGFDLDLGLKTRYIDFWRSDAFKGNLANIYTGLIPYLNTNARDNASWFDIEALIGKYVTKPQTGLSRYHSAGEVENDKGQFELIRNSLATYLENEVKNRTLNSESCAAMVLRGILATDYNSIYSFNYTDLKKIAEKLGYDSSFAYTDVHGRSADKSLILGIDDGKDVYDNYDFAYKTYSPYYHSVHLKFDLEDADEVVIFGLSMGDIDYPYFQDFFRQICLPSNKRAQGKRVTIFTYNEASRIDILRQLRAMNDKRVNYMYGQNEFSFIRTSVEEDKGKLAEFLNNLLML